MAISDTQKVDYLWKKLAYGKTKTDTGTNKQGFEESIASPLLIRGDKIWAQSGSIPVTIATASGVVTVYTGTTTVECTEDATAADNRTWKTNLTDWISPEFGADYLVSVYIATSGITGSNKTTQVTIAGNKISAGGLNDDQWYFDYQSGVLHFIGTNIPTAIATGITGKSIYITGARYTGTFGLDSSSSTTITDATLGNLRITSNVISSINTNDNINISPNGTGNLVVSGNVSASSLTLSGNLIVNGTTTSVNSTVSRLVDPIIELGGNVNGTTLSGDDNKDRGLLLHYYSGSSAVDAFMGWDDSAAEFILASNVSVSSEVVTYNRLGNLRADTVFGTVANFSGNIVTTSSFNGNLVGSVTGTFYVTGGTGAIQFANDSNILTSSQNLNSTSNTLNVPNITASNISLTGANVSLGNVSNIKITGGSSGYVLKTDGAGNLSWGTDSSSLSSAVDEFTGTGSQSNFTLSVSPTNKNFTFVVLQGLMQPKSSYSVSGNTLTFSEAPPNGAFIEVTTLGLG